MAIKIFCSSCEQFIRNASPSEISNLTGQEICENCANKQSEYIVSIEKAATRAHRKIDDAIHRFSADCEEAKRHLIKGEESNASET